MFLEAIPNVGSDILIRGVLKSEPGACFKMFLKYLPRVAGKTNLNIRKLGNFWEIDQWFGVIVEFIQSINENTYHKFVFNETQGLMKCGFQLGKRPRLIGENAVHWIHSSKNRN
jgi:hypothetical protein